ncbi:MAG TPA: hypothetical protein VKS22_02320 [Candidatus Binataceae bacterium]|nr:hypothetical protein [Candidatus Binataceae bacterium]
MRFEDRLLRTINRRLFYLGVTASAVIIGLTIAVTILALKRVPPYVVALDQGRIVGYAHLFTANDELAPMVIENQLRQFIYDARVVSGNDAMQDHNIHAVYAIARPGLQIPRCVLPRRARQRSGQARPARCRVAQRTGDVP